MLELREISYSLGRTTVVDRIDLAFTPGTITVLFGPRGAGKTSVLRMLTGELAPTSGSVLLDGESIGRHAGLPPSGVVGSRPDARRIFARDAEYVLLDEPGGCGDATPRYAVPSLFNRLARTGATVIAALHDLDQALFFADRIVLMHRGQVVTDGLPEIVLEAGLLRRVFSLPCAIAGGAP